MLELVILFVKMLLLCIIWAGILAVIHVSNKDSKEIEKNLKNRFKNDFKL